MEIITALNGWLKALAGSALAIIIYVCVWQYYSWKRHKEIMQKLNDIMEELAK